LPLPAFLDAPLALFVLRHPSNVAHRADTGGSSIANTLSSGARRDQAFRE
jgi:hypothetical protein